MRMNVWGLLIASAAAVALTGCAGGGGNQLTTSSVNKPATQLAQPAANPTCLILNSRIQQARQEGTAAKVHAAATGKTKLVRIKRASLAKAAELDRLNSEFQSKCSTVPRQQTAKATSPKPIAQGATRASSAAAAQSASRSAGQPGATAAQPIVSVPKQ